LSLIVNLLVNVDIFGATEGQRWAALPVSSKNEESLMRIFMSYTREKDKFMAVSRFKDRLEMELHLIDPESVLLQDKSFIGAGDHYPERLEQECKSADVLLVHLSPAWLKREWCRHEFNLFTSDCKDAARLHRVLPLLEVTTPLLSLESSDPIAAALARIEYVDIRELRHETYENPRKLRYVADVAARIITIGAPAS
jgi:hypothetical protein